MQRLPMIGVPLHRPPTIAVIARAATSTNPTGSIVRLRRPPHDAEQPDGIGDRERTEMPVAVGVDAGGGEVADGEHDDLYRRDGEQRPWQSDALTIGGAERTTRSVRSITLSSWRAGIALIPSPRRRRSPAAETKSPRRARSATVQSPA